MSDKRPGEAYGWLPVVFAHSPPIFLPAAAFISADLTYRAHSL